MMPAKQLEFLNFFKGVQGENNFFVGINEF
jgi:hypothetical protein